MNSNPDRNLALELVRVTETAAMAAAPWVGRGEKNLADKAAVEAMRAMINTVDMNGVVVIPKLCRTACLSRRKGHSRVDELQSR